MDSIVGSENGNVGVYVPPFAQITIVRSSTHSRARFARALAGGAAGTGTMTIPGGSGSTMARTSCMDRVPSIQHLGQSDQSLPSLPGTIASITRCSFPQCSHAAEAVELVAFNVIDVDRSRYP